jgi:hypothetical protein
MFNQDRAVQKWRTTLSSEGRLTVEQIDELEAHLRDIIDDLETAALTEEETFVVAAHRLGHPAQLGEEYEKITPFNTWRVPLFWATVGAAWTLGVEAILDLAVPLGTLVAARLHLSLGWMKAWAVVVSVGGPIIALASVVAWMRVYSASHPRSAKALFSTVAVAALLRLGSVPVIGPLSAAAWKGFDLRTGRSFQSVWQTALVAGFLIVASVGVVVLVRFREHRNRQIPSS